MVSNIYMRMSLPERGPGARMAARTIQPGEAFVKRMVRFADEPPFVVAVADIDDFARLNAEKGHEAGDRVIDTVTERLIASLPDPSVLSHVGDSWMCAVGGLTPEEGLLAFDGVRRSLEPLRLSIGVAGYPDHTDDPSELPRLADEALARAKRDRGNRTSMYVEEKMVLKSNYYPRGL